MTSGSPIDIYVAGFDGAARATLEQLRDVLREAVPGAEETIAYGIPTLDLHGRHVVHFAGFAKHVGLYPTPSGMTAFDAELARYARGKGSVRFGLDEPLPIELIRRIMAFRLAEVTAAAAGGGSRASARAGRRSSARGGSLREAGAPDTTARPTPTSATRRPRHPMPDAVRAALEAEGLMAAYQARPPYQRNDYLGWIARGQREATRAKRLRRMLDELAAGDAYMGMAWRPRGATNG